MRTWSVAAALALVGCIELDPDPPDAPTPAPQPTFCTETPVRVDGDGPYTVDSDHYTVTVGSTWTRSEAEELGRLAEASWFAFADWFGAEAPGPLEVILDDSAADWEATIAGDGLEVPVGAGGYFHPTTERAYLFRQPTVYYTRVLLLHEMAHQYHRLGAASTAEADWYVEGMAEALGRHHWDGDCVQLGVRPLATLEDFPARALARWEEGTSVEDIVADAEGRPLGMALVRFLADTAAEGFAAAREAASEGDEAAAAAALLDDLDDPNGDFDRWLRAAQHPMRPEFLEWLPVDGATLDGWADGVVTFARLKEAPTRYEQVLTGDGDAGALIEFDDRDHYTALIVAADGAVSAFEVGDDGAFWWDAGAVAPRVGPTAWSHVVEGDEVVATIGGEEIRRPRRFRPAAGPALADASVRFEGIRWDP